MSLKARALEASKKQKMKNCQSNTARVLEILEDKYDAVGKIVGECVIVGAGTNNELKFKLSTKYGGRGDVKVWHHDAWHEVYGLGSLGDILSLTEETCTPQTLSEQLVELLDLFVYEIAQEALDNR